LIQAKCSRLDLLLDYQLPISLPLTLLKLNDNLLSSKHIVFNIILCHIYISPLLLRGQDKNRHTDDFPIVSAWL